VVQVTLNVFIISAHPLCRAYASTFFLLSRSWLASRLRATVVFDQVTDLSTTEASFCLDCLFRTRGGHVSGIKALEALEAFGFEKFYTATTPADPNCFILSQTQRNHHWYFKPYHLASADVVSHQDLGFREILDRY